MEYIGKTLAHVIGEIGILEGFDIILNEDFIIHNEAENDSRINTLGALTSNRPELLNWVIVRTGSHRSMSSIWIEKGRK